MARTPNLPYDPDRPLLFHVLHSMPEGPEGARALERLFGSGEPLVPGKPRRGAMGRLDREAGDGACLFFSPLRPFHGVPTPSRPTLGFDLDALAARGPVGWRPHDLLPSYGEAESRGEPLEATAEAHTVWGKRSVETLLRAEASRLRGGSGAASRASDEVLAVFGAPGVLGCPKGPRCAFDAFNIPPSVDRWPDALRSIVRSEVMLVGGVPARDASWVWDGISWRSLRAPQRGSEGPLREVDLMALFVAERACFATLDPRPHVARAELRVVDRACGPSRCGFRDVAWAQREVGKWGRVSILSRALALPRENLIAILRHELGHLVDPGEWTDGAEATADALAARVGGVPIRYDEMDLQTIDSRGRLGRPSHLLK